MTERPGTVHLGPRYTLSPREFLVLYGRANGLEVKDAADQVGISKISGESHMKTLIKRNKPKLDSSHKTPRALLGCLIINGVLDEKIIVDDVPTTVRYTQRQMDVVSLLLSGMSTSEIAQQLGVSVGKVYRHVSRIYKKASANNYLHFAAIMASSSLQNIPQIRLSEPHTSRVPKR